MRDDAELVVKELADRGLRLVLAESCTGGLVAAELARIPGVSRWFCGSAVTYRDATKTEWLGVSDDTLREHTAVSRETTTEMARGMLQRTPEASLSVSVTGHFGPGAPEELDGTVFTAIASRVGDRILMADVKRHQLRQADRESRQIEATGIVLGQLLDFLSTNS